MKDKAGSMITSKQLIFIIVGSQVGIRLVSIPRLTNDYAREDAWLSVILGAVAPLAALLLIELLCRRFPEMGLPRMARVLCGKLAGSGLVMVFIVYIILLQALTARLFVEISKLYLLPKTPEAVILFMYMTTVIYAGSKGARVLGRLNEILFYISVVVLAIIFISLSQADLTNILPVGSAGAADIFKGALATMYHYSGIEAVLVFYTLVARKQEVMKSGIAAIIITMLTYVVVAVICQLVLGTSLVQKLVFPGLTLVKAAPVPVIERFEFIFLVFWVGLAVRPTLNMSFAASLSLSQLLGINLQKHFAYVLTAVSLLIFICALIPRDILQALRLVPYAGWLSITMGIGFPLLLLLVSFIRGKKVENGA